MIVSRFENGGFVIHKIVVSDGRRCSAWFDASGEMLDAEILDSTDQSRDPRRDGPQWKALQSIGRSFSDKKGLSNAEHKANESRP